MFHSERGKGGGDRLNTQNILNSWSATVEVFLLHCRPEKASGVFSSRPPPPLAGGLQHYTVRIFECPPGAQNEPVQKVCTSRRETDLLSGRGAGGLRP